MNTHRENVYDEINCQGFDARHTHKEVSKQGDGRMGDSRKAWTLNPWRWHWLGWILWWMIRDIKSRCPFQFRNYASCIPLVIVFLHQEGEGRMWERQQRFWKEEWPTKRTHVRIKSGMESQAPAGNSLPGRKEPKLTTSEKQVARNLGGGQYSGNHCERNDENLEQELQGGFEKRRGTFHKGRSCSRGWKKEQKEKGSIRELLVLLVLLLLQKKKRGRGRSKTLDRGDATKPRWSPEKKLRGGTKAWYWNQGFPRSVR